MNRVFIFENSNSPHETSVLSALAIFNALKKDTRLVLGKTAYKNLSSELNKTIIYRTFHPIDLLKLIFDIKSDSFLLFNTISLRVSAFTILFALLTKNNIFYLRNANSWFNFSPNSKSSLIKLKALLLFWTKRLLLHRAKLFAVGHTNMKGFVAQHSSLPSIYIPFNLKKELAVTTDLSSKVKIVIPGTVDFSRKNNSTVVDALSAISPDLKNRLEVVLLGRPVDQYSKEALNEWAQRLGNTLIYYTKFIPQQEFDFQLNSADIILGSINIHHNEKYYTEIYGQTKDTGIEAHATAYSKPLFVNTDYMTDPLIESAVVKYSSSQQLTELLEKVIVDKNWLDNLKFKAVSNGSHFTLEHLANQIGRQING